MKKRGLFSSSQTSTFTASTCSTASEATTEDGVLLYPEEPVPAFRRQNTKDEPPIPRRGGVLFKDNSQYQLQPVKYADAKKSILKVASLEDSLRSCLPKATKDSKPRRSSFNLESLSGSMRSLLVNAVDVDDVDAPQDINRNRGCISLSTGMDMDLATSLCLPPGKTLMDSHTTATTEMSDSSSMSLSKTVQFSNIQTRLYPVAPDDNPSVSGKGPAIALSGWKFKTLPDDTVDDYEANRGPRRPQEDLKLDMMERRQRLLEHGASQKEVQEFARRAYKAKMKRLETVQAAKIYGKQHEARLEQRAKVGRFFQRALGFRRSDSRRLDDLWDKAQQ